MSEVREGILKVLRSTDDFVSGQRLCEELSVSRAAISKQVQGLRKAGYDIESIPRRGHRLIASADMPLSSEVRQYLKTKKVGKHYSFAEEISSTNTFLADLPLADCTDGMVVAADMQTAGRGRMQRSWFSPSKTNLQFSVLLQPKKNLWDIPQLALIAAVSVVDALNKVVPEVDAGVKWPNDILVGERKLAGILCEMQAESDVVHKVILGIGINVNTDKKQFPADIKKIATSLQIETGKIVNRPLLMAEILNSLDKQYSLWLKKGIEPFLPVLKERLMLVGRKVKINRLDNNLEGVIQGLSEDGGLIIKDGKNTHTVNSGEVTWR